MDRFSSKQPSEAYFVEFDFGDYAGSAIISSANVTAKIVSTGVDVTTTIIDSAKQTISGTSVYVWIKAGTDGTDYQITCIATASDGSIYELEGLLLVAEVPVTAETAKTGPGLVVRPTIEPISLAEAKDHLEEAESDKDEMIIATIQAAREIAEDIMRRALLTQTWNYCLKEWPSTDRIRLPFGNLQSVTFVKWKDCDGTETTLTEGTDYIVEKNDIECGYIVLPYGVSWPSGILYPSNPITIQHICGWTRAADVPQNIRSAIKLICTDLYKNREGQELTSMVYVANPTVMKLLINAKLYWEF